MTINVPDWCIVGKTIEWHAPNKTGFDWVKEQIISYGVDGFFHKSSNCPTYYTKFSEYGKTVRECE